MSPFVAPITIRLGDGADRVDVLHGGRVEVHSRFGLEPTESLLLEAIPARATRILTVGDRQGLVALGAIGMHPEASVEHHQFDAYLARLASRTADRNGLSLEPRVAADLPGSGPGHEHPESSVGEHDTVLLAAPAEALFLRELVEEAHDTLRIGGRLLVAAKLAPARLVKLVKGIFGGADRQGGERRGVQLVSARRTRERRAWTDRTHVVERQVAGLTLSLAVRPGVFGARGLDAGTRALIVALREAAAVSAGVRVLDIGCGTGALGVAAHLLGANAITFVDSSARAVALARDNARRNGLDPFDALLRVDLEDLPGPFQLALANPPYFGDYRIARSFVAAAHRHLAPGGELWLVAKSAEPHRDVVAAAFGNAEARDQDGYGVIVARR